MAIAIWAGYPRSYTAGRPRPVQFIIVHYTAGAEGPGAAEAGAAYDKRRLDGTSTHVFADSDTVVREVWDQDQAHAALQHGNWIGLQLELCGTAQTREQWLDDVSLATLRLAAKQCAEWCRDHGIPVRRLSVAETRAAWYAPAGQRPKGFVGHVDVTQAYPEDGGTHTDPGPGFPWDVFLGLVSSELREGGTMAAVIKNGDTGHVYRFDTGVVKHLADDQQVNVALNSEGLELRVYGADDFQRVIWNYGLEAWSPADLVTIANMPGGMLIAPWLKTVPAGTIPPVDHAAMVSAVLEALQSPTGQAALVQAANVAEDR